MFEKILQKIGDFIIDMVNKANNQKDIELIYSMGLYYDDWVIRNFKIYLK